MHYLRRSDKPGILANFPVVFRQQSVEMHEAIRRCKCGSSHLVYDNVGHGDFVIDWQVRIFKATHHPFRSSLGYSQMDILSFL